MPHLTELGSAALAPCAYSVATKIFRQWGYARSKISYKCFYHSSSNACKLLTHTQS